MEFCLIDDNNAVVTHAMLLQLCREVLATLGGSLIDLTDGSAVSPECIPIQVRDGDRAHRALIKALTAASSSRPLIFSPASGLHLNGPGGNTFDPCPLSDRFAPPEPKPGTDKKKTRRERSAPQRGITVERAVVFEYLLVSVLSRRLSPVDRFLAVLQDRGSWVSLVLPKDMPSVPLPEARHQQDVPSTVTAPSLHSVLERTGATLLPVKPGNTSTELWSMEDAFVAYRERCHRQPRHAPEARAEIPRAFRSSMSVSASPPGGGATPFDALEMAVMSAVAPAALVGHPEGGNDFFQAVADQLPGRHADEVTAQLAASGLLSENPATSIQAERPWVLQMRQLSRVATTVASNGARHKQHSRRRKHRPAPTVSVERATAAGAVQHLQRTVRVLHAALTLRQARELKTALA